MILSDSYKLNILESADGLNFQIDVPFIPLWSGHVGPVDFPPTLDGKVCINNDLASMCARFSGGNFLHAFIHFDLSAFILKPGLYCPNTSKVSAFMKQYDRNAQSAISMTQPNGLMPFTDGLGVVHPYTAVYLNPAQKMRHVIKLIYLTIL